MKLLSMTRLVACGALFLMFHTSAFGGDKTLMHCFTWTPVKEATAADWDAFYKASDAMPQKIQGVVRVWYGKLASPLGIAAVGKIDDATVQKLRAGETVMAPVSRVAREYGMCIEMKNADVLKAYTTDPYHQIWNDAYAKVRVEGTTTFNILGQ
jgi:hypothetical protein